MPKRGFRHTKETRRKMSQSHTGLHHSEETKRKIGSGNKGKTAGRKQTKETIRKMSISSLGHKHSFETKQKIGRAQRGEKGNNWKGGITPKRIALRNSPEMAIWREFVFKRDDYTCQECLKRGGVLHSHHIKSFAKYPHLRFQTWNGITLCRECHNAYHWGV